MPRKKREPAIVANCPVCGKEYKYNPSWPVKTCSRACYEQTRRKKVSTTCPECGKVFEYHQSWPRKYCSNACKGKANIGNIKHYAPSRYATTCETCGKQYETTPGQTRGRFCSRRCHGDWLKRQPGFTIGKKFGRAKRLPEPSLVACKICGEMFLTKPSHLPRRKCCSKVCLGKHHAQTTTGHNNPQWKGGYQRYYGPSWHEARRQARARDKVCADCGKTPEEAGRELDVHHIVPFRVFGRSRHTEANHLDNLVCLCNTCHTAREWQFGRHL
jgi:hypothetical protein